MKRFPTGHVDRATRWIYRGVWSVLVRWFRVPDRPPALPIAAGDALESFQPSAGFLRYLKFKFWVLLAIFDGAVFFFWLIAALASPVAGAALALPALVVAIVPDVVAYIAIHLQYDTTWYVMTQRSLRIRRGIWVIHETTITFENVQNVEVNQGPLQRFFGIADVRVDTAGGAGAAAGAHGAKSMTGHRGLIEGISDAPRIRDMVLSRLRRSRTAGLGDEDQRTRCGAHAAFGPRHVALLREIRDLARSLADTRS